MSIGAPSALGTLLVQRLDAVLGTTLSQQTNVISGARPDAVSQLASAESADAGNNVLIRHPQESVDRATRQIEQGARHVAAKPEADSRLPGGPGVHNAPDSSATTSASTRLGFAARTILALLAEFPEKAPPVLAKTPLSNPGTQAAQHSAGPKSPQGTDPNPTQIANKTGSSSAGATGLNPATAQSASSMAPILAKALAQALQGSGLFYESHLADVAFGKRPALSLASEPQAQMHASRPQQTANSATNASSASSTASIASTSPPPHSQTSHVMSSTSQQQTQGGHAATGTTQATHGQAVHHAAANIPAQAHLLVRQQLEVLANQACSWQGEAWPNASMRWEVSRDQARSDTGSEQQQHWATRIRIALPRLGNVDARLTLVKSQLFMHLSAPDSAGTLDARSLDLQNRLVSAGLMLGQLAIDAKTHDRDDAADSGFHDGNN